MKKIFNLFIMAAVLLFVFGCSSDKKQSESNSQAFESDIYPDDYPYYKFRTPITMKDSVEYMLNMAIERNRYNDKSGMYELEFGYLNDQLILDQYIRDKRMMSDRPEILNKVEVISVNRYSSDSALANVKLYIQPPNKELDVVDQQIVVYHYRGRWVRPTLSKVESELQYQRALRKSVEQYRQGTE